MAKKGHKKRRDIEVEETYYSLTAETKKGLAVILLLALAVISLLSFFNLAGIAGVYINLGIAMAFGVIKILFPLILLFLAYILIRKNKVPTSWITYLGLLLFVLGLTGLIHLFAGRHNLLEPMDMALTGEGGGFFGLALSLPLQTYLGFIAATIILLAMTLSSLMLIFNTDLKNLLHKTGLPQLMNLFWKNPFRREEADDYDDYKEEVKKSDVDEETETKHSDPEEGKSAVPATTRAAVSFSLKDVEEIDVDKTGGDKYASKFKDIKIDLPLNLLNGVSTKPKSGDVALAMERIETTLHNFGIDVEMGDVNIGPTVTQYSFKPADGIKLSRITGLNNDLALALAAHPIRIEAPIPGKSLVGIEVPNIQPALVPLRVVLESESFKTQKSLLSFGLGKDVSGKCWAVSIEKMPHLLVAGATNSGKSVCLNTIIVSLLYQNNPDTLRLILVDPKRVEFTVYNGIPHLLTPVITDVTKTINALRWAIQEMDQRFDTLSKEGKRNIQAYNEVAENKMPYIVIIIDELADLMAAASAEVEACIIRLTQMARAVGIHLVVATQRPSVDIITGVIKANIPARIAFSVASSMDSRTILDSVGAEKLIGKGDMLMQTADMSKPRRLQGAYISDNEIKRIVNFLKQTGIEPEYVEEVVQKQKGKTSFDFNSDSDDDELLGEAQNIVVQAGKASASLLQRRLRVGYARAARLLDLLEERGVIGPSDGAKPRDVHISAAEMDMNEEDQTPSVFKSSAFDQGNDIENSSIETDEENTETPIENEETADEESPEEE
jgi:S-DNA-T family DNA segregation ATPase FtsK/SpoIIIE